MLGIIGLIVAPSAASAAFPAVPPSPLITTASLCLVALISASELARGSLASVTRAS